MQDSVFTKIIKGELPCHKIYEDDKFISFLTIEPFAEGHTLVIPKEQVDLIWDLETDLYISLMTKSKEIAEHIQKTLKPKRVGMVVEGFGVPHVHVHLIPMNSNLNTLVANHESIEPDHEALSKLAKKLLLSN